MARDTLADVEDGALLVLYANGDPMAARQLMDRLLPVALRYAARLLADRAEAEDVAQEAMLRLWRVAAHWRQGEAQPKTWLYRVVTNLCTDRMRARKSRAAACIDDVPEPVDPRDSVAGRMMDSTRLDALNTALQCLPERQRQAIILRHIEGMTNPEIAEVLHIGVEAVESLTARGKRALQALLSGQKDALGYGDEDEI